MHFKKKFFKALAKFNKKVLPNYTHQELDMSKASKVQLAIIGWKAWVTKHAVNQ